MPSSIQERIQIIDGLERDGRVKEAHAQGAALIADFPDDPKARHAYAALVARHMSPSEGMRQVNQFMVDFPENHNGPLLAAWIQVRSRKGKKALEYIERAQTLGAPAGRVQGLTAEALALLGRTDEAREVSSNVAGPTKDVAVLWTNAKLTPPTTDEELLALAQRAAELGETSAMIAVFVASWHAGREEHERAASILEEELSKSPHDEQVLLSLSDAEMKLGRQEDAVARVESAFARNPASADLSRWLGQYYWSKRRYLASLRTTGASLKALVRLLPR